MTFTELAQVVADDFKNTMKEEDFDTFDDMKDCYWWTTEDIKNEVDYIIRQATDDNAYIDELDRTDVFIGSNSITYRQFSGLWHKLLK